MAAGGDGGLKYEARWLIAKYTNNPPLNSLKISFKRMRGRQYYMIRWQFVWGSMQLMPPPFMAGMIESFTSFAFLPPISFWVCVADVKDD